MALRKGKEPVNPEAQSSEMADLKSELAAIKTSQENFQNQILALLQNGGPAVRKASDEEWSDMTRTEHVVTTGETLKAKTEAAKIKDDLAELVASAKSQKTLSGVIIGVKSANSDNNAATMLAEIQFGNDTCTVLIPSYELWDYDLEKYRTKDSERGVQKNMIDMIGAEVSFVVQKVEKKSRTAIASRLVALEKEVRANYIRETRTGKPRVMAGSLAEAKILAIKPHSIVVNVLGFDTAIPANQTDNRLSWDYVPDCQAWCAENGLKKNDYIQVRVQKIELAKVKKLNREYTLGGVKVSFKDTQESPLEKYWDTVHTGEFGWATVTGIGDAGVYCKYKKRVPILCKAPERGSAVIGEERIVEITLKEDRPETGKRVFGIFKTY